MVFKREMGWVGVEKYLGATVCMFWWQFSKLPPAFRMRSIPAFRTVFLRPKPLNRPQAHSRARIANLESPNATRPLVAETPSKTGDVEIECFVPGNCAKSLIYKLLSKPRTIRHNKRPGLALTFHKKKDGSQRLWRNNV